MQLRLFKPEVCYLENIPFKRFDGSNRTYNGFFITEKVFNALINAFYKNPKLNIHTYTPRY